MERLEKSKNLKDLLDRASIGFGANLPCNDILKPPEQSGAKRVLIFGQIEQRSFLSDDLGADNGGERAI